MKSVVLITLLLFYFNSHGSDNLILPTITNEVIRSSEIKEQVLIKDLLEYNLDNLDQSEASNRGINTGELLDYLISFVNQRVFPKHLRNFESRILEENSNKQTFVNYQGINGGCYQFRLFHKYRDKIVKGVDWASSVLTIPPKNKNTKNSGSSVVLAPSLQGATMFIEGGVWSQLCKKGVASLTPESIYKKTWFGRWKKIAFDPSPNVEDVLDFTLYESSIVRYKNLLEKNIGFLKDFDSLKTTDGNLLKNLSIMPLRSKQIGLWGSSFGAVVGSVILGQNPDIKGAVLTVGGGNLPYIVSVSQIRLFRTTREEQMKLLKINSPEAYEELISQHIKTDPLNYVSEADKNRVYMIIAGEDTTVPTSSQYDLYEKLGQPKKSFIEAGHVLTLLYSAWIDRELSDEAIDFLLKRLGS